MRPLAVSACILASLAFPVAPAHAQSENPKDLVKAARDKQRDFEMFRQSRIPVQPEGTQWGCDEVIGRMCIWFGGDDEGVFPAERPEVAMARRELLQVLMRGTRARDPWVMGQLVHYLADDGQVAEAERVARACDLDDQWWCGALLGYALHLQGKFVESEEAFRQAFAEMDKDDLKAWTTSEYILTPDGRKAMDQGSDAERTARWDLFWGLSDPLFFIEGNDRLTDHYARWVEARNWKDVENPQGIFWEKDLEEMIIRYGRTKGYSRTHAPQRQGMRPGGGFNFQDTRRVVGHHDPFSRGYLFPEAFLASPSDVPPESWITAPRQARTWYAPPYAPDMRALETQVGRFRRGDAMLVVGAYQPMEGEKVGDVEAGLALVPLDGGPTRYVMGEQAAGTMTLEAPPGLYVSSVEVLDAGARRAWRARQGVKQVPLVPGLVAVSDVLLLDEGAPFPESLDDAIPHVRRGVRIRQGERFTVVWEVYGLRVEQTAKVTLGFTQGRPGFLARVGDFLGVLEPEQPVEVTFDDPGAAGVQSAFRAVTLELPQLEPGEYTLHLRLDLPGREPSIASRPIVVEAAGGA